MRDWQHLRYRVAKRSKAIEIDGVTYLADYSYHGKRTHVESKEGFYYGFLDQDEDGTWICNGRENELRSTMAGAIARLVELHEQNL